MLDQQVVMNAVAEQVVPRADDSKISRMAAGVVHLARFKKSAKGFTLIELSIVIIVGSLLLAVALSLARTVMADNRVNDELKELPIIVTRIQKLYSNRATFAGLTNALAIAQNTFPDARVAGAAVTNRWGGTITVVPKNLTATNDAVEATYTLVPTPECLGVIPQIESNMRIIKVGATTVKADGAQTDLTALGTACNLTNTTTVVYTFSK